MTTADRYLPILPLILLLAGLVLVVRYGCGCRTAPKPAAPVTYTWPSGHEVMCELALERARECIRRKGGRVTERSCVAVLRPCAEKIEGQWAWVDPRQGPVGGLTISRNAVLVACSPCRTEINLSALQHELVHHLTGEPGHSERLMECYFGEDGR